MTDTELQLKLKRLRERMFRLVTVLGPDENFEDLLKEWTDQVRDLRDEFWNFEKS
jgi:hypothetical protein